MDQILGVKESISPDLAITDESSHYIYEMIFPLRDQLYTLNPETIEDFLEKEFPIEISSQIISIYNYYKSYKGQEPLAPDPLCVVINTLLRLLLEKTAEITRGKNKGVITKLEIQQSIISNPYLKKIYKYDE